MEEYTKGMNLGIGFEERPNYCVLQNCVRCPRSEERGSVDVIGTETKPEVLQYAFGYQKITAVGYKRNQGTKPIIIIDCLHYTVSRGLS